VIPKEKLSREERDKRKAEKKLARDEAKKARLERKEARAIEKAIRKQDKVQRKAERNEAREARKEARILEKEKERREFVFPNNITHLFLDGNNMLFVPAKLRALMIGRGKRKAEAILEAFTVAFGKIAQIPNVTLVFDRSSSRDREEPVNSGVVYVKSAHRAGFATSDDALADWTGKLKQQEPNSSVLCITSDRGLIERLVAVGGQTAKPKHWFYYAHRLMTPSFAPPVAQAQSQSPDEAQVGAGEIGFDEFFDGWVASNYIE